MPTVHEEGNWRFFFSSNDLDERPHIHIQVDHHVAKFWLTPEVTLAKGGHVNELTLRRMRRRVEELKETLLGAWNDAAGGGGTAD